MEIHLEFNATVAFTLAISVAACVAAWRLLRAAARRRDRQSGGQDKPEV